jgi:hypothetical protein
VSRSLGPSSVAWVTEYAFHGNENAIRFSLAVVNLVGMSVALLLFATGLGSYRRTLVARDAWSAARAAESIAEH